MVQPTSPTIEKGININAFAGIKLSHKRTRDRVRYCLAVIASHAPTERFLRLEVDAACGQPNKPLALLLRQCFVQVGCYSPRSNEWNEYVPNPPVVAELARLLEAYDAAQAVEQALRQSLVDKGFKSGTKKFEILVQEQLRYLEQQAALPEEKRDKHTLTA